MADINKRKKSYLFLKRLIDIVLSFFGVIVLIFPSLLIMLMIVLTSKGSPLFFDERVGQKGKTIKILKFRTMRFDAETNIDSYLTPDQKETWYTDRRLDNDPRVTWLGNILRKTSIDEIPQIFDVLLGKLSIVGPRPISARELELHFTDEQKELLLSARPGLTGYWQVHGRNSVDYHNGGRQKMELYYCQNRCFWLDIKTFFLTIPAVLLRKDIKHEDD